MKFDKINENLEEELENEEKKRTCYIGWLHNLHL